MNKASLYVLSLITLILTACGASITSQPVSALSSETLSTQTQLVVGTLQLEGTQQAVTSEQANELLPIWQVYQELTNNSTAAQEEIGSWSPTSI